jgi:hypothetical protein
MDEHYVKMPLQDATVPVKPICSANYFVSKLSLVFLMLFAVSALQAQCPSPPGDPAVFGTNAWNVYVYDNNDLSLTTTVYSGYYTAATLGFDTLDSWNHDSSPSNIEGWTGCAVNSDSFTFVYKRKGFPCGTYTVDMATWDDAAEVYIDGVSVWSCADMSCDGAVGDIVLNENSEVEVRVREDGGDAFASLTLVNNTPTVPGTLTPSGSTTICVNTKPGPITLSGHSGSIVKWQSAEDAGFTTGVTDIASTATVLTSNDMGAITATHYYRAVVQNGSCDPQYPAPVQITVPMAVTYSNGVWSDTLTETTPIVIDDDMMLIDDLTVCSCLVKGGRTLTVQADVSLNLATNVTVETGGELVIENTGSLVQMDDSAVNSGNIIVKRDTQPMKTYDYTYWSSPVQGNTLHELSPMTTADKYYRFDPIINNWVSIAAGAAVMEAGRGYIIRAPIGWSVSNASSGVYSGSFKGTPNNGVIPATIEKGAGTYNLIGNPYPSAIDIDTFLTDPANTGIVNGTVYLWTHNTAISAATPGNAIYNYTADDYAKYNLTGGVRTASSAITGGSIPLGVIASGQGFFIEAATELANGSYTVNFNNSMRIAGNNSDFYRVNAPAHATTTVLEKNRLWITISNTQGAYNQALIGYITNATNGPDALFDGKPWAAGNVVSLYSVNGANTYSIQGRALPFVNTDVVPLGYTTTISGHFDISLEDFDGLFQHQNVYLLDKSDNTMHDLKTDSYTFISEVGTFNDRFEIHYVNNTLSVSNPSSNPSFVVYSNNGQISVKASAEMTSVMIYDLLGRIVYQSGNIQTKDFKTPTLNLKNQALVVKAAFENETVAYKKLLLE